MRAQDASNVVRVVGTVLTVKQNNAERYGIKVGEPTGKEGQWFNGFGKLSVVPGNVVEVAYVTSSDGRFRNIRAIRVVSASPKLSETVPGAARPSDRDRFVAYSVGLKAAATLYAAPGEGIDADSVEKLAEKFADWLLLKTYGDESAEPVGKGEGDIPSSTPASGGGDGMAVSLPKYEAFVIDMKAGEFRRLIDGETAEIVPFDSPHGQTLWEDIEKEGLGHRPSLLTQVRSESSDAGTR